ncbi:lipase maturation factor family protein [Geotalea sp. SG265]|uniref:lipase maturation factor family protein n=1 Tax=Geotalea sp. SG265 TaxID=2922867 RepID=UPI001FAF70FC|nr:lipase maturation factor family protein [Geotalea sp. SG265]
MEPSEYWLPRLLLQRGLGIIYLMAFLVALNQFRPLCGEKGLLPAPQYMQLVPFRSAPSIFYLFPHDRAFRLFAWLGTGLALLAVTGLSEQFGTAASMLVWFLLWALYLSYVNIGQEFYAFGWESLLLECGFLAIFLGPTHVEPPVAIVWLYRWVLFRVMFGAGLIKLRGDPCWRDLSCLDYHFETQPMPNPASRFFHLLPAWLRRMGVAFNHLAELVMPVFYLAPQPMALAAGTVSAFFLFSIIVSGNFAWLNWLAFILCCSTVSGTLGIAGLQPPPLTPPPPLFAVACWGVVLLVAVRSIRPVLNMISPAQIMNTSFDPFHLVNTYGAFGSITRERYEIVVEGAVDGATGWKEYEFRGKPGDARRLPPIIAPYHLRLDWLMWFAAMPSRTRPLWFIHFLAKLLQGDRQVLGLLKTNPFSDTPPLKVRARYYRYHFTDREEYRRTGRRWHRELLGEYLPEVSLSSPSFRKILQTYGLD